MDNIYQVSVALIVKSVGLPKNVGPTTNPLGSIGITTSDKKSNCYGKNKAILAALGYFKAQYEYRFSDEELIITKVEFIPVIGSDVITAEVA